MTTLTEEVIAETMQDRRKALEKIKPSLSLKIFYSLEEKINQEQREFESLLDAQLGRIKILNKYTHILNTQYFEQQFLKGNG